MATLFVYHIGNISLTWHRNSLVMNAKYLSSGIINTNSTARTFSFFTEPEWSWGKKVKQIFGSYMRSKSFGQVFVVEMFMLPYIVVKYAKLLITNICCLRWCSCTVFYSLNWKQRDWAPAWRLTWPCCRLTISLEASAFVCKIILQFSNQSHIFVGVHIVKFSS